MIGLERLFVIHANDSKAEHGSIETSTNTSVKGIWVKSRFAPCCAINAWRIVP